MAGRRIGKTELLLAEGISGLQKPKSTTWYIAPTLKQGRSIFLPRFLEVLPKSWIHSINRVDHLITLKNKAQFQLHGAENPETLRGPAVDKILIDEADSIQDSVDIFQKILYPTLMTTKGKVVTVGSPNGFQLLHDFYVRGGGDSGVAENDWKSWLFRTSEFLESVKGHLPDEEYEAAKRDMDERSFNQEWNASFQQATGRVCYAWSYENCKPIEYEANRDVYVGMDFNVTPAASIMAHVDLEEESAYQFGEINMSDSWTETHALRIAETLDKHEAGIYVYGDPAGAKHNTTSKQTDWQIVERVLKNKFGARVHMRVSRQQIPERAKINALNARICNAMSERRYFINPARCRETLKDFEQVRANEDGSVDKTDKKRTHWFDGAGYLCHGLWPVAGTTSARDIVLNF